MCGIYQKHRMRIAGDGYRRCLRCNRLGRSGTPTSALFWEKVNKTETCWLWTALIPSNGYGIYTMTDRERKRTVMAHRFAYELLVGPVPAGMELDHLCKVRNCVNPAHLEPVTHQENIRRALGKAVCKRGHEQTPENRYVYSNGRQRCLPCLRKVNGRP